MCPAMRQIIFFKIHIRNWAPFKCKSLVKLKNGKANPFSNTNPYILGGFLGANINPNTNIDKNYLV